MRVHQVSGGYPGVFFLKDINFTVNEGKVYALLGLNGSGKTTIIKMICGLLKIKSGNVFIDNTDILTLKEKERAKLISYVPQQCNIVYDTSVIDVVLMGVTPYLQAFQTPNKNHVAQAYYYLKKFGLDHLAHTNYQILSGGLKQMVIIIRALLQNGRYLILDEPDSSLDLINKNRLMVKIRAITNLYNKGCLISMHNPEYALNYCDNIILVRDGKISEIDLAKEKIGSIEKKLSEIYGALEIIKYRHKYLLYYK